MEATIRLHALRFHAHHGVLPAEAELGQPWLVDVELLADLSEAARTDDLSRTVNYVRVRELVAAVLEGPRVQLIETLLDRLLTTLLADQPLVRTVTVTVHKPHVPLPGVHAGVSLTASRSR